MICVTGYSKDEIVKLYKNAKDKRQQINILAELCDCGTREIISVLKTAGMEIETGLWTKKKLQKLQKFIDEGHNYQYIAKLLGVTRNQIYNAVRVHKLRGKNSKKEKPPLDCGNPSGGKMI